MKKTNVHTTYITCAFIKAIRFIYTQIFMIYNGALTHL